MLPLPFPCSRARATLATPTGVCLEVGKLRIQGAGAPLGVTHVCGCHWYNGAFWGDLAMKQPCIDMECAAGANACMVRSGQNTFSIVICGLVVLFLLATAVFGLFIATRTCVRRECTRNISNTTLTFTILASVVQLAWILADFLKFLTLETFEFRFRDPVAIPAFVVS